MKIALLTFFSADNYGAILQAYATVKALQAYGHEVELVDYSISEPSPLFKKILLYPKHLKFECFRRKYFPMKTRKYPTFETLRSNPPIADCYLVGSDQVWNVELSQYKIRGFLLDFGGEQIIRASYASSFGVENWIDSKWIKYDDAKQLFERFDYISVRETSGLNILSNRFYIRNVKSVIDPVMLFSNYSELTGPVVPRNDIVLYKLHDSAAFYSLSKHLGARLGISVRSIGSIRRIKGIECHYPDGVEGWIRSIAGARFIMTDSFHGTVLSILYARQFVVFNGLKERFTRISSLLELLDLSDRIVAEQDTKEHILEVLCKPINYKLVHEKVSSLRKESLCYISNIK